jgi:hypothetical protein
MIAVSLSYFDPTAGRRASFGGGGSQSAVKWIDESVARDRGRLKPEAWSRFYCFPFMAFR